MLGSIEAKYGRICRLTKEENSVERERITA
jgi:hypothetical protein